MVHKPLATVAAMLALALGGLLFMGATTWDFLVYVLDQPTVTVAWDSVPEATSYNYRLTWIDPSMEFVSLEGTTVATQVELPRPRSGHLRLDVQACNTAGCSAWAKSNTSAGFPKPWIIYWKLPAPIIGGGE